ncbi:Ger(x)C family spore germination protein [Alteribacillus sp. HJP-4]|uniref:Ger(x)C family spore germination protein n=1 Tax=Alteribacillus sp. HJP-4 TaxID=2775394 RepID=UPI0035CCE15F
MKRRLFFLLILLLTLFMTGCWSMTEMEDLAIVAAYGIDKTDSGFHISAQIVNPSEIAQVEGAAAFDSPVTVYETDGETHYEAQRKLATIVPRKLYNAHMSVVVLGEDMARDGIVKSLDLFSRDNETRPDFYILVAKEGKASNILKNLTSMEMIPADKLFNSLEVTADTLGTTTTVHIEELETFFERDGREAVLSGVVLQGDPDDGESLKDVKLSDPKVVAQLTGLAVFKNDRLVGWLNENESKGYNYTQGNVNNTIEGVACPGGKKGKISVELENTEASITTHMEKGVPQTTVTINGTGSVADVECDVNLTENQTIEEIESLVNAAITEKVELAVKKAQELHTDIFGFGELIWRSDPHTWKELKNDWDQEFENVDLHTQGNVTIKQTGRFFNPITDEFKE